MKAVLHSFAYCFDYLREQLVDVRPEDMVKQPAGIVNHPAWVIGHLTYGCRLIVPAPSEPTAHRLPIHRPTKTRPVWSHG